MNARRDTPEPPLWEQMAELSKNMPSGERLQKVLAARGFGSRRVCEEMIVAGRVSVNGETALIGRRVNVDSDVVSVDGVEIGVKPDLVYYLLNKPARIVTTAKDPQGRRTVLDLVPREPRVFSIGRLDYETEGLLLLTNDGAFAQSIAHPTSGVEKEYLVEVSGGRVGQRALSALREGVFLDGTRTFPARVSQVSDGVLRIVIHEGRNRQIRRMCEVVGHPVQRLIRVRIGPISDRSLAPGHWRELDPQEIIDLLLTVAKSR